ncbi:DUF2188 domain-containing protein [Pseudomonas putida]|uniref:DUF2188 domain-containing protein n=1 Tax=Pseudomonas putida TaxID=303 RepID=UPI0009C070A5
MDNYHLSPTTDGWELKKAGAERASKRAATKQELISSLADFFDGKTASVKNHKADGTMEKQRTYLRSADPKRTEGWFLLLQLILNSNSGVGLTESRCYRSGML